MRHLLNKVIIGITLTGFAGSASEIREPKGVFPKEQFVKVAVIAFSPPEDAPVDVPKSQIDAYKKRTADALEAHIRGAAENGAELVVTPEFSLVGYPDIPNLPPEEDEFQNREQIIPYLEKVDGPSSKRFSKLAKDLNIWLVIGLAEQDGSSYYNTLIVFNPRGEFVTKYRKINLFEGEKSFLDAGDERSFFDTSFGRFGLFTCYDIHFDHPARDLVSMDKVDAIAFSTSWVGKNGMSTFRSFARQNNVYFLASNHVYFPDSGVVSPGGEIQSHITSLDGPAYGYMPRKKGR